MTALQVIPGSGLVTRTERFLSWSSNEELDVARIAEAGGDDAFKQLGAAVLESDFASPSFVVVDLQRCAVMVFGSACLATAEGTLDASTSSTWVERTLRSCVDIGANPAAGDHDPATDLVLGAVRGAGWVFGALAVDDDAPLVGVALVTEDAESTAADSPDPFLEGAAADDLRNRPLGLEASSSAEEVPSQPEPSAVLDAQPPSSIAAPSVAHDDAASSPNGQAEESSATTPDDLVEGENIVGVDLLFNDAPRTERAAEDVVPRSEPEVGPETLVWQSALPDLPEQSDSWLASTEDLPGTPMRAPGIPRLRTPDEQHPDDLTPAMRKRVQVRFDDGQEIDVVQGLYVGRNPTKRGIPEDFDAVTIRSEHVSRVHWALILTPGAVLIRDLGSSSGLTLKADGLDPFELGSEAEAALEGPVRVEFADRWADVDVS